MVEPLTEPNTDPALHGDSRAMFYSERLLGLDIDCDMPYCPHRAVSTGWTLFDSRWYIEYDCPRDGQMPAWTADTDALIRAVVAQKVAEGFDLNKTLQERHKTKENHSAPSDR